MAYYKISEAKLMLLIINNLRAEMQTKVYSIEEIASKVAYELGISKKQAIEGGYSLTDVAKSRLVGYDKLLTEENEKKTCKCCSKQKTVDYIIDSLMYRYILARERMMDYQIQQDLISHNDEKEHVTTRALMSRNNDVAHFYDTLNELKRQSKE